MIYNSQKNPLWGNKYLGFSKTKIKNAGCFITSISNLLAYNGEIKSPSEINDIAKKCGAFTGDMLNAGILAKKLGYGYVKAIKPPVNNCIVETNYFSKMGYPQHFVFFNPRNGKRVDSLDSEPGFEPNDYPIVSYRIFVKLTPDVPISTEAVKIPIKVVEATIPTPDAPQSTSISHDGEEVIKLSELPKIKEYTWVDEIKELIKDLINLFKK